MGSVAPFPPPPVPRRCHLRGPFVKPTEGPFAFLARCDRKGVEGEAHETICANSLTLVLRHKEDISMSNAADHDGRHMEKKECFQLIDL